MRYLLLSDLHANLVALEAVLHHAEAQRWERVIFLGDAVGYYPDPEAVIERLRGLPLEAALLGNHDALLLRLGQGTAPQGRSLVTEVLARQRESLSGEALRFLTTLQPTAHGDGWEAVHGARSEPWRYLSSLSHAEGELPYLTRDLLFFGHTHVPAIYAFTELGGTPLSRSVPLRRPPITDPRTPGATYRLPPNARVFVNPGSVGQPRDGVPLASYMVFDDGARTLEHHRVAFDIPEVGRRVRAAGYPESLATRLERGR